MLELVLAIVVSTTYPVHLPEKIACQFKPVPTYYRALPEDRNGPPPVQKTSRNRI